METLANWEGDWTTSHLQHAEPSCCFNSSEPGELEVLEPAQLIISQLQAHSVDHLLMGDGLVAHLETASDHCHLLRGQDFDCYPETTASPDSHHQPLWSPIPPAGSSSCISATRFDPYPQILTHDNSLKKRKRDWNPDPNPNKPFSSALLGSGSQQLKLISQESKWRWSSSSTLNFQQGGATRREEEGEGHVDAEAIQQMKEIMYRAAALRPVNLGAEVVDKPRRKNVRISSDPQTVAARQRRERISDRLRVLQKLVPGGCKMDTASMLDEAANYLKFLRSQIKALEAMPPASATPPPTTFTSISSSPSLNSHFSANQTMPGVGTFNLSSCIPAYYNNNNSSNDDDDDDEGGRISMISYHHPNPIPIPIAGMRHNPTSSSKSNPPFLLQQYAKS